MICAWDSYLHILPQWMRGDVDRQGRDTLQELRLRVGRRPELIRSKGPAMLNRIISSEDIQFCINTASRYSPWSAVTAAKGYITALGGHRIGICGDAVIDRGEMKGFRTAHMLCIRTARDHPGVANGISDACGSVLIIGKPGSGKTTLLRDLIRGYSNSGNGSIGVVDERGELFPVVNGIPCFDTGQRTDVLNGAGKEQGIEALLRCMSPSAIAVDEITAQGDCQALIRAGWCGVRLFATAHASCKDDLFSRPIYRPLLQTKLFHTLVTLLPDQSWKSEGIGL